MYLTTSWWKKSEMGKQFALEGLHLSHKAKLAPGRKEEPRGRVGKWVLKVGDTWACLQAERKDGREDY